MELGSIVSKQCAGLLNKTSGICELEPVQTRLSTLQRLFEIQITFVGVVSSCVFTDWKVDLVSYLLTSETLWAELQAIAADEGLRLYDIERYGAGALRVYVERVNVESDSLEQKTSSQDCTKLCRRLMSFFLVEGGRLGVGTEPEIEVSSPGVNRHLRLPEHFKNAVGERVKVGVRGELVVHGQESPEPVKIGGLLGKLESVSDKEVLVSDERTKKNWQVPFDQIARANVEFKFS